MGGEGEGRGRSGKGKGVQITLCFEISFKIRVQENLNLVYRFMDNCYGKSSFLKTLFTAPSNSSDTVWQKKLREFWRFLVCCGWNFCD